MHFFQILRVKRKVVKIVYNYNGKQASYIQVKPGNLELTCDNKQYEIVENPIQYLNSSGLRPSSSLNSEFNGNLYLKTINCLYFEGVVGYMG